MRISVVVKPNAHETKVEKIDEISYCVSVKGVPVEGRANTELIKTLAQYFKVAPSCVEIKKGHTGRKKIVEIIGFPK
jgi:uncharacterized protein (TIGR00251 family)